MVYSIFDMAESKRGPAAFARYERARTAIMVGSAVRAARRQCGMSQAERIQTCGMPSSPCTSETGLKPNAP